MRVTENWKDYRILDTTDGDKLESWGGKILVRPDPQIIWKSPKRSDMWGRLTEFITVRPKAAVSGNISASFPKAGISLMEILNLLSVPRALSIRGFSRSRL